MPSDKAHITQLDHGIAAIDTAYVRPLHDASHVISAAGRAAFVDTGTNSSVPLLLDGLASLDVDPGDVDFVFLTHVHLDHAGGAGLLMQSLPNAKAVLHPRGARHMADPTKVIKGSQAVYGEEAFFELYGELVPIPEERIVVAEDGARFTLGDREFEAFYTEGHARHHYCLADPASRGVFTGDSFGISYRELDTTNGEFIYPTTTPVHFDPVEAHKSVDRILGYGPLQLYLTHYSRVTEPEKLGDEMHRRIDGFVGIAKRHATAEERTARMQESMYAYLVGEAREHGCKLNDDALREVLRLDVELNTMGIEFWLDHAKH